jgi:hypothetical protein
VLETASEWLQAVWHEFYTSRTPGQLDILVSYSRRLGHSATYANKPLAGVQSTHVLHSDAPESSEISRQSASNKVTVLCEFARKIWWTTVSWTEVGLSPMTVSFSVLSVISREGEQLAVRGPVPAIVLTMVWCISKNLAFRLYPSSNVVFSLKTTFRKLALLPSSGK